MVELGTAWVVAIEQPAGEPNDEGVYWVNRNLYVYGGYEAAKNQTKKHVARGAEPEIFRYGNAPEGDRAFIDDAYVEHPEYAEAERFKTGTMRMAMMPVIKTDAEAEQEDQ